MTSPMVDTVRSVPLIIEKDFEPMEAESGFPFDQEDREDHFRSQLDDIAQRHPEFAQHLEGFPFRSDRRPPRASDQEFRRFTERPFGSGRFTGFPFSDPFDEPKAEQKQEEKPKQERSRKQNNIQNSNTVDLGQKQEPVNDRNQRSMSAPPPDNRQRYVSSIHIPINPEGGMGDMGKAQSQPQEKPVNKPTERVIPIHVEGRDEPVIPKHTGPSFTQAQPERIFGHAPSQFTQFVGREPPKQYQTYGSKEQERQVPVQKVPPQQQQPPQQHKQKQEVPQQQQQQPKQESPQPQPQPPKSNNPIDIIQAIQRDVGELMAQVDKFTGVPRDKQYLYLDEMLTRNLLKLDNIDTQGQENIRQARKEAIKCIESCINILEAKAAANVPQEPKTEEKQEEIPQPIETQEKMEVEEKKNVEIEEKEKMEVEAETKPETPKPETTPVVTEQPEMEVVPEQVTPPIQKEDKPQTDEEMKDSASENKQEATTTVDETENKVVNK